MKCGKTKSYVEREHLYHIITCPRARMETVQCTSKGLCANGEKEVSNDQCMRVNNPAGWLVGYKVQKWSTRKCFREQEVGDDVI